MDAKGRLELDRDTHDVTRVLLTYNGERFASIAWQKADEVADAFKRAANVGREYAKRGVLTTPDTTYLASIGNPFELQQDPLEASRTLIIVGAVPIACCTWEVCLTLAAAFRRSARGGEEQAKATELVRAQALLTRTGAPFALTTDPRIREAAYTDAQWDSSVRKAMPLSVPSAKAVGTFDIFHSKPDRTGNAVRRTPGVAK